MAVIRDWAIDAAVDVIDHVKTGSTLEWIAERIHAHSPFKPGVAYMSVPRCETCGHWMTPVAPSLYGLCTKMSNLPFPQPCSVDEENEFVSLPDFGCINWKAKS